MRTGPHTWQRLSPSSCSSSLPHAGMWTYVGYGEVTNKKEEWLIPSEVQVTFACWGEQYQLYLQSGTVLLKPITNGEWYDGPSLEWTQENSCTEMKGWTQPLPQGSRRLTVLSMYASVHTTSCSWSMTLGRLSTWRYSMTFSCTSAKVEIWVKNPAKRRAGLRNTQRSMHQGTHIGLSPNSLLHHYEVLDLIPPSWSELYPHWQSIVTKRNKLKLTHTETVVVDSLKAIPPGFVMDLEIKVSLQAILSFPH